MFILVTQLCQKLTVLTATPPRFFSELNGKAWMIVDADLVASKFIPSCKFKTKKLARKDQLIKKE